MEVNPNELSYEFRTVWFAFRSTKVHQFLFHFLKKEEHELRVRLENTTPEDLGKVQGALQSVKKILLLLDQPNVDDAMKQLVTHLEKK